MNRQILLALIIFIVILIIVLLLIVTSYNSNVTNTSSDVKTDTISDPGFLNDLNSISNDANYNPVTSDIIKIE